jgi:putative redox protein
MRFEVSYPGGKRVDVSFGDQTVRTDQPPDLGGDASAPAPYDLFLASLAACAGIYALGFCQARGLPTEGLRVSQDVEIDPVSHLPSRVTLEVTPPVGFPEKSIPALLKSVELCKVKKTLAAPPEMRVREGVPRRSDEREIGVA